VPETGGKPEPATRLDETESEVSHRLPHPYPGGRIVYTAMRHTEAASMLRWDLTRTYAQRPGATERSLLTEGGSDARWVSPGILVVAREGVLVAARLASSGKALAGPPTPVLDGFSHSVGTDSFNLETGAAQIALSGDGRIAFAPGSIWPEFPRTLAWVDPSGRETPIDTPPGWYLFPRTSPDGKRLLLVRNTRGAQVEILDLERGTRRRVSFEGSHAGAAWGPGASEVTFGSDHEGPRRVYVRGVDAPSGEIQRLSTIQGIAGSWSPDGAWFSSVNMESGRYVTWLLPRGGEAKALEVSRFNVMWPNFSPDGKWIAYGTDESGRFEVYVRPLDGARAPRQVSTSGGAEPVWSRDGASLYYRVHESPSAGTRNVTRMSIYRVRALRTSAGLEFDRPTKILTHDQGPSTPLAGWDVTADGRFLVAMAPTEDAVRAYNERVYPRRIRVDLFGLPMLLEKAERKN
jgi:eukaryotic-like serine/threonine-protein kinase